MPASAAAAGGISTNRMCRYGKKKTEPTWSTKTGRLPFSVRRFVQRRPTSRAFGQLEQVGDHRLLVVEVQDSVADHAAMVPVAPRGTAVTRWSRLGVPD